MMTNELETDIYATLIGVMEEKHRILGVEDDEDVEGMVIALESIQTALCIKMFRLGQKFGKMDE